MVCPNLKLIVRIIDAASCQCAFDYVDSSRYEVLQSNDPAFAVSPGTTLKAGRQEFVLQSETEHLQVVLTMGFDDVRKYVDSDSVHFTLLQGECSVSGALKKDLLSLILPAWMLLAHNPQQNGEFDGVKWEVLSNCLFIEYTVDDALLLTLSSLQF